MNTFFKAFLLLPLTAPLYCMDYAPMDIENQGVNEQWSKRELSTLISLINSDISELNIKAITNLNTATLDGYLADLDKLGEIIESLEISQHDMKLVRSLAQAKTRLRETKARIDSFFTNEVDAQVAHFKIQSFAIAVDTLFNEVNQYINLHTLATNRETVNAILMQLYQNYVAIRDILLQHPSSAVKDYVFDELIAPIHDKLDTTEQMIRTGLLPQI